MTEHQASSLAGVIRVVFFLAVAVVGVTTVVIGVTTLYEAPSGDGGQFEQFEGFDDFVVEEDEETADYNRNVGLVFSFIGMGTIALGLLGLGSRFNPLRAGLLGAGVALVLAGVITGSNGSDDWLTFVTSGLAFLTLVACSPWLDEGLPMETLTGGAPGGGGGPPPGGPGGGPSGTPGGPGTGYGGGEGSPPG